jgi:hypothetical protein
VLALFVGLQRCFSEKQRPWRDVGEMAGARGMTRMVAWQDLAFVLGGRGNSMSCNYVEGLCPMYLPVAAPMLMFDAGSNSFTVLNSSAGVDYSPPVREDHGMAISGDRIFAYGGRRREGIRSDGHFQNLPVGDLLMFSLSNLTWTPLCKQGSADCSSVSTCILILGAIRYAMSYGTCGRVAIIAGCNKTALTCQPLTKAQSTRRTATACPPQTMLRLGT